MYLILPADEVTPPPPSAITSSNLAQPSFLLFIGLAWQHRCLRALTWVGGTCLGGRLHSSGVHCQMRCGILRFFGLGMPFASSKAIIYLPAREAKSLDPGAGAA